MRDYTNDNPVFSDVLPITEVTTPALADYVNEAPITAFNNTLVLKEKAEDSQSSLMVLAGMLKTGKFYGAILAEDGVRILDENGVPILGMWKFNKA